MIALALATVAAVGVALLVWPRTDQPVVGVGGDRARARRRRPAADWMAQAGLPGVSPGEFAGVVGALGLAGGLGGLALFGGPAAALAVGVFTASFPVAAYRRRRHQRMQVAAEAWPRMLEELRVLTSSLGRSVPQALFEVGRRGPADLRPAFEEAHREWVLTTDFARTVAVLKARLADPTADAALETLLVAHDLGGSGLDRRLEALIEDRTADVQGRKDARAKQAGVRFARRFVLIVPLGMAVVGLQIGDGRAAYRTPVGQLAVVVGVGLVAACWAWAGRIMRLPEQERVFHS